MLYYYRKSQYASYPFLFQSFSGMNVNHCQHRKVCEQENLSDDENEEENLNVEFIFRTHTMLGPNPKKAATPSTASSSSSAGGESYNVTQSDGLMVKAIDDIFKFVETSENPKEFRVSINYIYFSSNTTLNVKPNKLFSLVFFYLKRIV